MEEREYRRQNFLYGILFFILYIVILGLWIFVLSFRLGIDTNDKSMVLVSYMLDGKDLTQSQVDHNFLYTFVDSFTKFSLLIFSGVLGTILVAYNIFPRLKRLSWVLIVVTFALAYLPSLFSTVSFISHWQENHYLTVREFVSLLILYPLNYAVFFFMYYLVETYFLTPLKERK